MQSAYALRICIADTDCGSVRMEMYINACHMTQTWSRDTLSTMEELCFQQKFLSSEDNHLLLNTDF